MYNCTIGDNVFNNNMAGALDPNQQSDFQCQVGDTKLVTPLETSDAQLELTGSKDFQCQAYMNAVDGQGQIKNVLSELSASLTTSVHSQVQCITSSVHCQAEIGADGLQMLKESSRPGNKPRTHTRSTETKQQPRTTSSASQCDLLTSVTSSDVQCQTTAMPGHVGGTGHHVKVSASADVQCQATATQSDFQCQFNDNVNA